MLLFVYVINITHIQVKFYLQFSFLRMLKLSQGRKKKQVDIAVTAPNTQNRKKPVLYAPIRLISYSTKTTLGSNAVKNRMVAMPAVMNEGQSTATTR